MAVYVNEKSTDSVAKKARVSKNHLPTSFQYLLNVNITHHHDKHTNLLIILLSKAYPHLLTFFLLGASPPTPPAASTDVISLVLEALPHPPLLLLSSSPPHKKLKQPLIVPMIHQHIFAIFQENVECSGSSKFPIFLEIWAMLSDGVKLITLKSTLSSL